LEIDVLQLECVVHDEVVESGLFVGDAVVGEHAKDGDEGGIESPVLVVDHLDGVVGIIHDGVHEVSFDVAEDGGDGGEVVVCG